MQLVCTSKKYGPSCLINLGRVGKGRVLCGPSWHGPSWFWAELSVIRLVDIPADDYLTPASTRTRALHTKKLRQYASSTDALKYSFFPRTITTWNSLSASIADAPDLVSFKRELSKSSF